LNGIDLGIIQGEFGVSENGAVWVVQNVKERGLYFIAEYLVILLDKNQLVNNMHEAYSKVSKTIMAMVCLYPVPLKQRILSRHWLLERMVQKALQLF